MILILACEGMPLDRRRVWLAVGYVPPRVPRAESPAPKAEKEVAA